MTKLHYSSSGKEKDSETGLSYFGARYYEPEMLNIWLSMDPMADKYPNLSPYNYCAWTRPTGGDEYRWIKYNIENNPIKLVDPDGMEIADFYDMNGQYLGTDGVNDGRIFVVTNDAEIELILNNGADCSIQFTDANTIKSKYQLVSQSEREKIINELTAEHDKIPNREYGGMFVEQMDESILLGHYIPGPVYEQGSKGTVSPVLCEDDKWMLNNCTGDPALTRYHTHGKWLNQSPSDDDYANYSTCPTQYGYAMQMGMMNKIVNFYSDTKKSPLFSMSFDTFINIGK